MKTKDQVKLEEAYQSINEGFLDTAVGFGKAIACRCSRMDSFITRNNRCYSAEL